MTFDPNTPAPPPSDAELDRVRTLLASLGDERAPADVIERLERVLAVQLPAAGLHRRRSRRLRGRALAFGTPLVLAAAVAVVVLQQGDSRSGKTLPQGAPAAATAADTAGGAAAAGSASELATPGVAPAGTTGADATRALSTASSATAPPAASSATAPGAEAVPADLERAARRAYDAVDRAIRQRHRNP